MVEGEKNMKKYMRSRFIFGVEEVDGKWVALPEPVKELSGLLSESTHDTEKEAYAAELVFANSELESIGKHMDGLVKQLSAAQLAYSRWENYKLGLEELMKELP